MQCLKISQQSVNTSLGYVIIICLCKLKLARLRFDANEFRYYFCELF